MGCSPAVRLGHALVGDLRLLDIAPRHGQARPAARLLQAQLVDYAIRAVTGGTDALGEVTARVREGEIIAVGRASSTDILEASVRAYLDAVNRLLASRATARRSDPAWA